MIGPLVSPPIKVLVHLKYDLRIGGWCWNSFQILLPKPLLDRQQLSHGSTQGWEESAEREEEGESIEIRYDPMADMDRFWHEVHTRLPDPELLRAAEEAEREAAKLEAKVHTAARRGAKKR